MASAAPSSPAAGRASSPRRRQPQSWFWPGFAAGFLLLSALSCGMLFAATGLGSLDLSDIQGNAMVWTPPPAPPTPEVVEEATPGPDTIDPAVSGMFQAGDIARNITSTRVNLRQVPGYLGKPNGDVIAQVLPGETMEILGGRAIADNLVWWLVRYRSGDGREFEGWIAEATASGVQILGR